MFKFLSEYLYNNKQEYITKTNKDKLIPHNLFDNSLPKNVESVRKNM